MENRIKLRKLKIEEIIEKYMMKSEIIDIEDLTDKINAFIKELEEARDKAFSIKRN